MEIAVKKCQVSKSLFNHFSVILVHPRPLLAGFGRFATDFFGVANWNSAEISDLMDFEIFGSIFRKNAPNVPRDPPNVHVWRTPWYVRTA